ncbi:PH domain-containing protein [Staphylococcus pettenkoferi]|uniref:PH domain-containing protein n=2 Tax=Staphylococcus TaxID=1279 RepID=A0A9Q4H572_9STAP|nr:PH domain-containing protein [Staphylococcus pettenkoferi]MCY1570213.1 PH domain-containing protein [Staphylococcus pettenkoferi]MCY1575851.1 PH domain-containing protein [Staphylococcus pettenkoferi]MCY1595271.1 PH domain-containing protein [Staphylococcus pettenkoferi]MCY1617882.1 PH domain-containing protein [Staphylococcus pettenkoferi]
MKELPKNRLTFKELWVEVDYLKLLDSTQKKEYKKLSIEEKRERLNSFKNQPQKQINFQKEIQNENTELSKIYKRFNEIGVHDLFGTKKEVKELPLLLKENEKIMYATSGLFEGNTYLIICTDKRLLFLDKGMIYGLKFHEFPFDKINSVSYKKGIMFGQILVYHGSSYITINSILKETVSVMANAIQFQIETHKNKDKNNNQNHNNFSAADELLKYKQLLDAELITQEEFNKKKRELI